MSYHSKPYKFHHEGEGSQKRTYTSFRDSRRRIRKAEVTEEVSIELELLSLSIRNLSTPFERKHEHRYLSEEEQAQRGAPTACSAEDEAYNNFLIEELKEAFLLLSPTQVRRFLLAKAFGFTYAEIADMEGCSRDAIKVSLVAAKKNPGEF